MQKAKGMDNLSVDFRATATGVLSQSEDAYGRVYVNKSLQPREISRLSHCGRQWRGRRTYSYKAQRSSLGAEGRKALVWSHHREIWRIHEGEWYKEVQVNDL